MSIWVGVPYHEGVVDIFQLVWIVKTHSLSSKELKYLDIEGTELCCDLLDFSRLC